MSSKLASILKKRKRLWLTVGVFLVAAGGWGSLRYLRPTKEELPTAQVTRGEFVYSVELRGEVKATRSVVITTPSNAGDILIVKLTKTGTQVRKGDIVAELDTTALQNTLDQRKSDLKQAEAQIENSRAQAHLTEEQDQTALLKAQYDVERARLEASKQEILSKIDGEKNKLLLTDAEQKLNEAEQKLASDKTSAAADLASVKQKREKALYDVRLAEDGISKMILRAPVDGIVNCLMNFRAGGPNQMAPLFKEGDRAWPGAAIAEVPDMSTLRIRARVDESDRGRLRVAQTGTARVDAVPDKEFAGTVDDISPLAKPDFNQWPPPKNFDLLFQVQEPDQRLRPGMSSTVRVAVERVPNSILIPAEAVFVRTSGPVVYVLRRSRFEERRITVARRNTQGRVAIGDGLDAGDRVALKDPTLEEAK
jgi:RND family efflux transporter MFP subunit